VANNASIEAVKAEVAIKFKHYSLTPLQLNRIEELFQAKNNFLVQALFEQGAAAAAAHQTSVQSSGRRRGKQSPTFFTAKEPVTNPAAEPLINPNSYSAVLGRKSVVT